MTPRLGEITIYGRALDKEEYQYAFVSGPNESYLWLLSRTPMVDNKLKIEFENKGKELGFETQNLIWVNQDSLIPAQQK